MRKPTMLYASPFPPLPSGISDYSVVLVKALSEDYDITLYIDDYAISEPSMLGYPVIRHGKDAVDFDRFDYRIYNMGNSAEFHSYIYEAALSHPGLVILHDFSLYHFFRGYYDERRQMFSRLYQWGGNDCLRMIKEAIKNGTMNQNEGEFSSLFPLNSELLGSANLFMVHSKYTYDRVLETRLINPWKLRKINHIALLDEHERDISREKLFKKFGIPEDALVIAAFGYIQKKKLNKETIHAVQRLSKKTNRRICYVMVGDGDYIDALLEPDLIVKTGYTELDEFNSIVDYVDIIVNLRNPSLGETSGSMLRILQKGKPCITNNGGWFSEIPDECVCKIELDDIEGNIEKAIRELADSEERRKEIGEAAKRYVEEKCGAETIRRQIAAFLLRRE